MFLEDKVGALQSEVEQSITTQEAYENQIAILNQSLANLEAKLRECNEEKVGTTQPAITCSKLTIETLKQGVKYVQS